ncbi:unnamed protein product [Lota lota]
MERAPLVRAPWSLEDREVLLEHHLEPPPARSGTPSVAVKGPSPPGLASCRKTDHLEERCGGRVLMSWRVAVDWSVTCMVASRAEDYAGLRRY